MENIKHKFNFTYTDRKLLKKLVIAFLAIFTACFGLLFLAVYLKMPPALIVFFLISALFSPLIIYLYKKRLRKRGTATIYDTHIVFQLSDEMYDIQYADIMSYYIMYYNGTTLKITSKNKQVLTISANNNAVDDSKLLVFCIYLNNFLQEIKQNSNNSLYREKTIFEKKWFVFFLLSMTILSGVLCITVVIYSIAKGKMIPAPGPLFAALGTFISLSSAYYRQRKMLE
jgi:hypothetical protein